MSTDGLTFEDIRWQYNIGQDTTTGSGRNKTHVYTLWVQTPSGRYPQENWVQLSEQLVEQAGEHDLFMNLRKWVREQIRFKTMDELYVYTLQLHVNRIFDNKAWVGYVEFNRKYRPEVLSCAKLIPVKSHCCEAIFEVTPEMLRDDKVPCGTCGRFITFERMDKHE